MSPVQRLVIGAIFLISGIGGFATGRALFRPSTETKQAIAFNHQKHVGELGMECDLCHTFYASGRHAGLPTLEECLVCHEEALTDLPEEQKIRDLAADGRNDVFVKLFKLADHALYSHRLHVTVGKLECPTCHGGIAETTVPPEQPLVRISMDFCVGCHERQGLTTQCTRCHR